MQRRNLIMITAMVIIGLSIGTTAFTAYNHEGDTDSVNFRTAHPNQVGTKLDSCTLCHSGGSYVSGGKTTTLGSCQWCHYITKYGDESNEATLLQTLNSYGLDYKNNGRDVGAFEDISGLDSDGDGYKNGAEIAAIRYPGDPKDDPTKVPAPYQVYTLDELERMPQHTQFLLMNASKSDDSYTKYSGVALETLLRAMMLDSATGITVYSPDGFATYHPFNPSANPNSYHVLGIYPEGTFYYDEQADMAENSSSGWCNYSSPSAVGRENGSPIYNPDGLKMMLAFKREGEYLTPGVLNSSNKLDGEGPFRVVPPQKSPGPPDQRSTAKNATDGTVWVWPYTASADHNAGFSSRTVTMIRVEPLPEGTTDIDPIEAGWDYVEGGKILMYGAVDPVPTIIEKLDELILTLSEMDDGEFKDCPFKQCSHKTQKAAFKLSKCPQSHFAKWGRAGNCPGHLCRKHCHCSCDDVLVQKLEVVKKQVLRGAYAGALEKLQNDILKKTDGCVVNGAVDRNDWVTDCDIQAQLYWAMNEIIVLLNILV